MKEDLLVSNLPYNESVDVSDTKYIAHNTVSSPHAANLPHCSDKEDDIQTE